MNEARLQKKCVAYAKLNGWLAFKWASPAHRGVPDVLFFKLRRLVIVEFKSPEGTGKLSPLQAKTIDDIEQQGFDVFVVSSFHYFQAILNGVVR